MAATPSFRLDATQRGLLLETAVSAIEHRLDPTAAASPPDLAGMPEPLARLASSFVTLHTAAGLRGCCGTLEPLRPLALDVWRNAQASAFDDPRFAPLLPREWPAVTHLEISVLAEFEPLDVRSESELLRALAPGIDGLVLAWRGRRATFLPKVWEQVGDAREFLRRLKAKAGWPEDFWSPDIEIVRYRSTSLAIEHPAARARRGGEE